MFSSNLKKFRMMRNLSQEDIAQKLHITRQTVSGWETGRCQPDIEMLKSLAEVLNVDVQELICGTKTGRIKAYDRDFLIPTCIFGGLVVVFLLFRMFFYASVLAYRNSTYNVWLGNILLFVFPQIGFLTGGMFLCSLHNMFSLLRFSKLWKRILRCVGIVTLSFTTLTIVGSLPLDIPVISRLFGVLLLSSGRIFMLYVLPFLAGGILMLSVKK